MIYKSEIHLNTEKKLIDLKLEILKIFKINNFYELMVNLRYTDYMNTIILVLTIRNRKTLEIISKDEFNLIHVNKNALKKSILQLCKTYKLHSNVNDDIFLIKVTADDIIKEVKQNHYNESEIKNEILFTDFMDKFQFIDLCIFIFDSDLKRETENFFINKALYFGYPDIDIVFNKIDVNKNIKDIISLKTFDLDDIAIKLYKIAIFKICSGRNIKLFNEIENEYIKVMKLKKKKVVNVL